MIDYVYKDLCNDILKNGSWINNPRTDKRVLTKINYDFEYDASNPPILTTRKIYWKSAIAEILGHIRGYTNAKEYEALGCKVWLKNANENEEWLKNHNRKHDGDMGLVYGAVARNFPVVDPPYESNETVDLIELVYNDLKNGVDNRGEIITFYHPGMFHLGCLRPCLYQYQYSIINDTLYLNAFQRSCDVPIGLSFNMLQVYFMLVVMAKITNLKPGKAYHKIINAHIYEDQMPFLLQQLERIPMICTPTFSIDEDVKTLEDLNTWVTPDNFKIDNYEHHGPIQYPFTV